MTISELHSLVLVFYDSTQQTIIIPADAFADQTKLDTSAFKSMLTNSVPFENQLSFRNVSKSPFIDNNVITFSGECDNNIFKDLANPGQVNFSLDTEGTELYVDIHIPLKDAYKLSNSYLFYPKTELTGKLAFNSVNYFMTSHEGFGPADSPYPIGLSFLGTPILGSESPLDYLTFLLKDAFPHPVSGWIDISTLGPSFDLHSGGVNTPTIEFLSIKDLGYYLTGESTENEDSYMAAQTLGVGMEGTVVLKTSTTDHELPLQATYFNSDSPVLFELDTTSEYTLLVTELEAFFGNTLKLPLPGPVLSALQHISLQQILFAIDLSPLATTKLQYYTFNIGTTKGETWPLDVGGKTLMTLEELEISYRVDRRATSGNSSTVSNYIHGFVSGIADIGTSGRLEATASFYRDPSSDSGKPQTDFEFGIELIEGPLSVNEMLTYFMDQVPSELPGINIDELSFSYDTATQSYGGECELEFGNWYVWKQDLSIRDIIFKLHHSKSEGSDLLVRGLIDCFGHSLFIEGSYQTGNGWSFAGGTTDDTEISLKSILAYFVNIFGASLPNAIPNIKLSNLDISFNTKTKNFHFSGKTSAPITVPFLHSGHSNKEVTATVEMNYVLDPNTQKHQFTGFIKAEVPIGGSTFDMSYEIGKDGHDFMTSWIATGDETLEFREIPAALGIGLHGTSLFGSEGGTSLPIHSDLDLKMTKVMFRYQAASDTLLLEAVSNTYGTAFFVASRAVEAVGKSKAVPPSNHDPSTPMADNAPWHYAFGLQFDQTGATSPQGNSGSALGSFSPVIDHFQLQEFHFAVASADFSDFEVPDLQVVSLPTVSPSAPVPIIPPKIQATTSLKLYQGFSVFGVMDFATGSGAVKNLSKITGGGELIVSAGYKAQSKNVFLSALLEGGISIPTGKSSDLAIQNPYLEIDLGSSPLFKIAGEIDLMIDHQKAVVTPAITITDNEIEISASVQFDPALHGPKGLDGLFLDDAGMEMGINFVPPGFNFGLQGNSHVGTKALKTAPDSKKADFAMVLEVVEAVPNPELVAFYLDELDIPTIVTLFVGGGADLSEIPAFIRDFKITDLAFCWADSLVTLPDGSVVQPGFNFSGVIDFANTNNPLNFPSIQIYADLEVHPSSGIKGMFEMSPMHYANVLDITGNGKGVYRDQKTISTNPQRVQKQISPTKDAQEVSSTDVNRVEVVAPGGPVLQFNTAHSPYLNASLNVSLFHSLHFEVEAEVSDSGMNFELELDISDIAKAVLKVKLDKTKGFYGYSTFGLHLKTDVGPLIIGQINLGTLHLDTGFDLNMTLTVSPEEFKCELSGDFEFEGLFLQIPKLTIDVPFSSFKDIPEELVKHIEDNIDVIFKDLLDFGKEAFDEMKKGVEEIGKAVDTEVKMLENEAEVEVKEIEEKGEAALNALKKAAVDVEKEAEEVKQKADKVLTDAATTISHLASDAAAEVGKIDKEIDEVIKSTLHEIDVIDKQIIQELADINAAISRYAQHAIEEIKHIGDAISQEVKHILLEAHKVVNAVTQAAQKVVAALEKDVKKILADAKELAKKAKEALERAAQAIVNAGKKILHKLWPW